MAQRHEHQGPSRSAENGGLTVDELSQLVGMSARNIRSHQARKLLPPPVRRGRIALYSEAHVRRLRTILALQRQGFNLVSIEAILGARNADPGAPALLASLERLAADQPVLIATLRRHNIVTRGDDGGLHLARPQVVRTALRLHKLGTGSTASLRLLGDLLDRLQPLSEELTSAYGLRLLALAAEPSGDGVSGQSRTEADEATAALTQGIVDLLSEAFRIAVENCSEAVVAALVRQRA